MGSRHFISRFLLIGLAYLFLLLAGVADAKASFAEPTEAIVFQGKVIGYESSDPNVVYLRPDRWTLSRNRVFLEPSRDGEGTLYFVVEPRYDAGARYAAAATSAGRRMVFLPLPYVLRRSSLFLSSIVGAILTEVSPSPAANQSPLIYYKLSLRAIGLDALRKLARSGSSLLGTVEVTHAIRGATVVTSAPVDARLSESDLLPRARPSDYGLEWITELLTRNELILDGVLDGPYSLGLLSVDVTKSSIVGELNMARTRLRREGDYVVVTADGTNFAHRCRFHVVQTDTDVEFQVDLRLGLRLSLADMTVAVEELKVVRAVGPSGGLSGFIAEFINKVTDLEHVRARISESISDELRRRVIAGSLFLE
ncbi:hypothetical protein [Sorangium sp. So ce861]|uniref:hypothetical protein n=1 Tax=Sorangium sp. So ce861 TaxID=3133323 RepID=UPI003F5F93D1